MDRVAATGETVVITKHGRPVARLVAAVRDDEKPRSGYGCMKGTILDSASLGELLSTGERWDADHAK
jgi:antitoxin (DNA-binding transcriptional repressor) of toxin-antitoxin stability system